MKKELSIEEHSLDKVLPDKEASPHEQTIRKNEKEGIIKIVHQLDDKYKEMLIMFYFQMLKIEEISTITNQPVKTINTRL